MKRPPGFVGRSSASDSDPRAATESALSQPSTLTQQQLRLLPTQPVMLVPARLEPIRAPSVRRALKEARQASKVRQKFDRQERLRFTKGRRIRRRTILVLLGSVLLLITMVIVGAYSPLMALRVVRVEGAHSVSVADVEHAFAGVYGTPLPLISATQVSNVLAAFVAVESYRAEFVPPNTLVVRLIERTPIGVVANTGGGYDLVDVAGVVLNTAAAPIAGYPVIRVPPNDPKFVVIATVVRSLPLDIRSQLTEVSADSVESVQFKLGSGVQVIWGGSTKSSFKATVLAALVQAQPADSASFYDVSSPNSPVIR